LEAPGLKRNPARIRSVKAVRNLHVWENFGAWVTLRKFIDISYHIQYNSYTLFLWCLVHANLTTRHASIRPESVFRYWINMKTVYNIRQKRARLEKEIVHYESQMQKYANEITPRAKASWTRAKHCLSRRKRDWATVIFSQ
jgi:hypothetical protein